MQRAIHLAAALAAASFLLAPAQAKSIKSASGCQRAAGTWRVTSFGGSWTYDFKPNGVVVTDDSTQMTWTCSGNTVTLSHFGQNARLNLSPDGNHMSGSEAGGISITAVRTSAPTSSRAAPAQTSVAPAVKGTHASATTGSSRQRYCAAKWPAYRDAWSRMCNNEADFEDVAEGMCNLNTPTARQQFMTKCLSGEDPEMPN
jgi:hypothetical protein